MDGAYCALRLQNRKLWSAICLAEVGFKPRDAHADLSLTSKIGGRYVIPSPMGLPVLFRDDFHVCRRTSVPALRTDAPSKLCCSKFFTLKEFYRRMPNLQPTTYYLLQNRTRQESNLGLQDLVWNNPTGANKKY